MSLHKYFLDFGIVKDVFSSYGFHNVELRPPQYGYRNYSFPAVLQNKETINLILYKSEPYILKKIKTANDVTTFLNKQNLPVRHVIDPRIIKLKSDKIERYGAIYNYLQGETIPWEAYTRQHLKCLGKMMATMHQKLLKMPEIYGADVAQEYILIFKRMQNYFNTPYVIKAINNKLGLALNKRQLEKSIKILEICRNLPEKQMLHMDFVRGNILFSQESDSLHVSGILDFEKAGHGHVLLDIARTMAFLLVDCKYKSSSEVHKHFLISGYARSGQNELKNISIKTATHKVDLLEELTTIFMLHDFYKFLRHNPYEFLHENEHFVRTRDLLVLRGVITTSQHTI
jgi:Ser/Thr protein kinase RdoA (MazF antagonist)